jgi:metal-dependent HD superfamily phosphatase/phosphodiesterase
MVAAEPDQVRELLTMHGVVPIMEMLEVDNRTILHALLKLVNMVGMTKPFYNSLKPCVTQILADSSLR